MTVLDLLTGVVRRGTRFQVPQHGQLLLSGRRGAFQTIGETNLPAGGLDHLLAGHARMQGSDDQLLVLRIGPKDAQIGDHDRRATANVWHVIPRLAIAAEADSGDEVYVLHEGTLGM